MLFLLLLPGPNPSQSGRDFKDFLHTALCVRTPLNVERNGVLLHITNNVKVYSTDCLQKLRWEELDGALAVLRELFCQLNPPPGSCAAWSNNAARAGHLVGRIYILQGGHARTGELGIQVEHMSRGIFQSD